MKKNKLLMLCLGLILGVTTFTFAGCTGGNPGGGDDGGGVESGGGNQGGSDGGGTETPDPEPTDPVKQAMSVYFSGMKATYQKASVQNENKQSVAFNEVLDRQIDVLAQDLIYRLTYVYGYNINETNRRENAFLNLKNIDNSNYEYNYQFAKVNSNKLLSDNTTHNHNNFVANCLDCFQKSLLTDDNSLLNTSRIYLAGAIEGKYTTLDDNVNTLNSGSVYRWNWSTDNSNYENYLSLYKDKFKMAIVEILTNQNVTTNYDESSYNKLLNKINKLGYSEIDSNKIVEFINNFVIGKNLIDKDLSILNSEYFINSNYIVDAKFQMQAPYKDSSSFTDVQIQTSPRLFKGYSIVIPAMVEQALNNTFENTDTSIYPTLNRFAVKSYDNANGVSTSQNYSSIVLMPKGNTPTTRLVLKMQGDGESVGKTIMINFEIKTPSRTYSASQQVTLSNVEQEVELNLYALTNGAKLNAYNGGKENYNKTELFGAESEGPVKDGDNYIKLSFANTNNSKFIVKFDGLYDKMYRS